MKTVSVSFLVAVALLWHWSIPSVAESPAVTLVRVPNGGIQPEAVIDASRTLHLLYFAGAPAAGDLFYVTSRDFGRTFSTPIRVNSQPGSAIATGTIRGGHIAIGRNGRVYVTWNGSGAAQPRGVSNPADGRPTAPFLYTRSNPEGTRFEAQRNLTSRGYFVDGGGSVAADGKGNVYAAWHAAPVDGSPGEEHRVVWVSRSSDDGATFAQERPAWREPTGACGCCGLQIFSTPGALYVLYRSATAKTHRDIFLLRSTDQARTFQGARVQPWEIAACPMTSMSLATSGNRMFGAWETAGQVYYGQLDAEGVGIPNPRPAPGDGQNRKHPRLATNTDGDVLFVWTEGTAWARGGSLAWQVFDRSGQLTDVKGANPGIPMWSFAAAVARPDSGFVILY